MVITHLRNHEFFDKGHFSEFHVHDLVEEVVVASDLSEGVLINRHEAHWCWRTKGERLHVFGHFLNFFLPFVQNALKFGWFNHMEWRFLRNIKHKQKIIVGYLRKDVSRLIEDFCDIVIYFADTSMPLLQFFNALVQFAVIGLSFVHFLPHLRNFVG